MGGDDDDDGDIVGDEACMRNDGYGSVWQKRRARTTSI